METSALDAKTPTKTKRHVCECCRFMHSVYYATTVQVQSCVMRIHHWGVSPSSCFSPWKICWMAGDCAAFLWHKEEDLDRCDPLLSNTVRNVYTAAPCYGYGFRGKILLLRGKSTESIFLLSDAGSSWISSDEFTAWGLCATSLRKTTQHVAPPQVENQFRISQTTPGLLIWVWGFFHRSVLSVDFAFACCCSFLQLFQEEICDLIL